MTTIGEVINRLMEERGMNVSQLSIKSMLPAQSVWYVIRGGNPKIETLTKIARGLDVNPVEILAEVIEDPQPEYSDKFVKKVINNTNLTDEQKVHFIRTIEAEVGEHGDSPGAQAILNILQRMNGEEAPPT